MKQVVRRIVSMAVALFVILGMIYISQIDANAHQNNRISGEELAKLPRERVDVGDIIMTADDFLLTDEKSADYNDIHEYLRDLEENGIEIKGTTSISQINKDSEYFNQDENDSSEEDVIETEEIAEENETVEDEAEETRNIDKDDWRLILVNKQNPVPDDYDEELSNINSSLMADSRIIDDIYRMLDAANEDGVNLMICSAYRSYDRQTTLFNNKMNKLMNQGMNYMEAYAVGSMSVTVPGTSEHQLGLALDILTSGYVEMDDGFGETEAGIWLAENAPDYGFILRYPKDKEEITGIIYEPWHFRYVGEEYSKEITELGVCLEEYLKGEY